MNKELTEAEMQAIKPFPFYGYAPGNYMNTCACCKKDIYNVDKLCFVCLECAIKASVSDLTAERQRSKILVEALEGIKQFHARMNHTELLKVIDTAISNYQNNKL